MGALPAGKPLPTNRIAALTLSGFPKAPPTNLLASLFVQHNAQQGSVHMKGQLRNEGVHKGTDNHLGAS